jgi:hypothetical protein
MRNERLGTVSLEQLTTQAKVVESVMSDAQQALEENGMAGETEALVEQQIGTWFGVSVPNEQAREMTRQLTTVIQGFHALRGTMAFEDEPSSFEAALLATKDQEVAR